MIELRIKRLDSQVALPAYAYEGDAGLDVCANEDVCLKPGEYKALATGLSFEIPLGYVGFIWDRSGLSIKRGVKTLGGVIDSGYRGEVKIGLINLGKETVIFSKGERVAQMVIQQKPEVTIIEIDEVSSTQREDKGFGSSGI